MPRKPTQTEKLENLEIMVSSLLDATPDPEKPAPPTLPRVLLFISSLCCLTIVSLAGLKYLISSDRLPVAVHTEVHNTTTVNNQCWLWCSPGK